MLTSTPEHFYLWHSSLVDGANYGYFVYHNIYGLSWSLVCCFWAVVIYVNCIEHDWMWLCHCLQLWNNIHLIPNPSGTPSNVSVRHVSPMHPLCNLSASHTVHRFLAFKHWPDLMYTGSLCVGVCIHSFHLPSILLVYITTCYRINSCTNKIKVVHIGKMAAK